MSVAGEARAKTIVNLWEGFIAEVWETLDDPAATENDRADAENDLDNWASNGVEDGQLRRATLAGVPSGDRLIWLEWEADPRGRSARLVCQTNGQEEVRFGPALDRLAAFIEAEWAKE